MTRRRVMSSLAALLVAVVGIEVFLGTHDRPLDTGRAEWGGTPPNVVGTRIEFPPVDRYSEFVERPLFSNTRRAFSPSDTMPVDQTASNLDLELSGTALSGTQKLALIKTKGDNAQHRVGRGEEFRGWTLEDVLADKVVIKNGAQTQELALIRKGDPLATKRKKLQKQSQKRKQAHSAKAQAGDKKAENSERRRAAAGQDPEHDPSAESESEEEQ